MPPSTTVDIKLSFEQYDMTPGVKGRKFITNLRVHGGKCDAQGYSLADVFARLDEGAQASIAAGGGAAPGAPPIAGTPAVVLTKEAARRARLKEAYRFITAHVSDANTIELVAVAPYFQDGAETYDYIHAAVVATLTASEIQDMQLEFMLIEIVSDVGIREDTVHESLKILRVRNNEFPLANRYTDDELAQKLLKMIMNASSYLSLKAQTELDAAEGVPGAPGVREHQLAVPAAGGPRPRNLNGIVVAFHALWSAAFGSRT